MTVCIPTATTERGTHLLERRRIAEREGSFVDVTGKEIEGNPVNNRPVVTSDTLGDSNLPPEVRIATNEIRPPMLAAVNA